MTLFDELQSSRNEKIDLIRLALSNYTSPYKVNGYDAVTLNNLTEFVSNNIIYKKRKDYTENDLSNVLYKYAYRYFTQFVTPTATVDLIEMMILYNKYMAFNIGENAMSNIFGISEKFKYNVSLVDDAVTNINQNSSMTFSFSIPYVANEYRSNLVTRFKLKDNQFSINGKIMNINTSTEGFIIYSDFELRDMIGLNRAKYDLLSNGRKVAQVEITLQDQKRGYNISNYTSNLIDNITGDLTRIINSMYISETSANFLSGKVFVDISDMSQEDRENTISTALSIKKNRLISTLEKIKADGVLDDVVLSMITQYCQDTSISYMTSYGTTLSVSKLANDAAKHIKEEINHTGIALDELYIIFKNSTNSYDGNNIIRSAEISSNRTTFENFLNDIFRWSYEIESSTETYPTDLAIDVSKYFITNVDASSFVTYRNIIEETLIMHLYTYIYKYFILMDIKTLDWSNSTEKDRVVNTYEINQISESRPINYLNVVHKINNQIIGKLDNMVDILKINNNNTALNINGNKSLSLTFQYKELNKEIYDLFMQDQVETYVANWLTKSGSIKSLFNSIYINNFNESAWELATSTSITLNTLNKINEPNYFKKAKKLVGNTINFREKDYMDIVGYFLNSYDEVYYGMNSEHKQEIALFIRSFQDVRDYYFKNILLKALVNSDEYPLYEYILLVTMALDRYFNQKVAKHKDLDSYTTEEINNFLDSFGLSELNKYDNFYGSFDYKMSVIRNYNRLIKNKGTRRAKSLIEEMLNDGSDEYKININEYYIAKSTKESINYVMQWYYDGSIYTWDETSENWIGILVNLSYNEDTSVWVDNTYTWYDVETNIKHTSTYDVTDERISTVSELINSRQDTPVGKGSPVEIGAIQYNSDKDSTLFINVPEGTNRPITLIKNKIDANSAIDYETFTEDDLYWSKDVTQKFINSAEDGLNLNISKTKYLSISASINMEVAKIMNMYIMSILDNIVEKMNIDLSVESYSDDYLTISDISYVDLIKYIKFITKHLGDVLTPWEPTEPDASTISKYYGVPKMSEIPAKLAAFETSLKSIINTVDEAEIDEFMRDNIDSVINNNGTQKTITSINRYAYESTISNLKQVIGTNEETFMTSRLDGTLQSGKLENSFTNKIRKLLLGFGYSSIDFQNSAIFIIDLLESTNLLSIMEEDGDSEFTKAKYLKLLSMNNTSSQTVNISNLYAVNLRSLVQMIKDYTDNKIYKENYALKDSSVTNTLAINKAFVDILELVVTTFFERSDSVYDVSELDDLLTAETPVYTDLPDFIQDFIELLRQESISETDKSENLPKYNGILNSLNTVLSFMTSSKEYELLSTLNTINKNFSDAEYLNFLISLLSFFMSYKVTLYEESHQLDLSNPRETFIFAEDLLIWSEIRLEEDWFFDEEILEIEVE